MSAVEAARDELARAHARSEAATPGGLHGDPATLSGVRRRGGHRADRRRFAAYDAEAEAAERLRRAEAAEASATRAAERAARDAAAPCDLDTIGAGDLVRDRRGWHRVVRLSAKSVTVETAYSWTDRILRTRIVETRAAEAAS